MVSGPGDVEDMASQIRLHHSTCASTNQIHSLEEECLLPITNVTPVDIFYVFYLVSTGDCWCLLVFRFGWLFSAVHKLL